MKALNSSTKTAAFNFHPEKSFQAGLIYSTAIRAACRGRLTVVNYHRVIDAQNLGTNSDHSLVSADTVQFAAQMDFIGRYFNVVGINQLLNWLSGTDALPDYPLLITFDDGYRDNYQFALPILQHLNFPAILFVASDCIESTRPFYWDLIAYCFNHTKKNLLNLPMLNPYQWNDENQRELQKRQLQRNLKKLPEIKKLQIVEHLPDALDVAVPADAFSSLYLNWDQVRALNAAGVAIGGHTKSHPILSRITLNQARSEITESKTRIESEIGEPLRAFAYPNGQRDDFNIQLEALLKKVEFEAAFSLIPGPTHLNEIKQNPFAIRRIYINRKDSLARFTAKLLGISRLLDRFNRY